MITLDSNKYKMYSSTVKCASCNSLVNLASGKNIYRSCDAYVCSPTCSKKRLRIVSCQDPYLTDPSNWEDYTPINIRSPMKKTTSMTNVVNCNSSYPLTIEPYGSFSKLKSIKEEAEIERKIERKIIKFEEDEWSVRKSLALVVCGIVVICLLSL